MPSHPATRPPRLSVAMVSMAALAYEILLMRLFSIIQWHHFAYMIISLALLGYGASGTFVSLLQRRLLAHFRSAYAINIGLFGICAIGCYLVAQQIRFNAEEVLWDAGQPLRLMAIYLLLALPFFFAANAIALALAHFRDRIAHVYAADLAGAGLGSLGIVGLLYVVLFPAEALCLLGALGLTAAAVAWWEVGGRPRIEGLAFLAVGVFALGLPPEWTALNLSPYKGLESALRIQGAQLVDERSGPLGLLSVVESPAVPLRHAPGLSLIADALPPEQLGVFTDGGNMTAIARDTGDPADLAYLDQVTSALPYHLARPRRVLVLGAGGGAEVLQALYHGAEQIDAVELNPQMIALVRDTYGEYSGDPYGGDEATVHAAEARGFAASSEREFDLVQLALLDSFGASSAGLYALSESYLYTVEGLQAYLRRLAPDGY
ncbi:MAG: SAM-dependent methyltransferase, partial [Gammaproteobacteria bacterium]|nr:SAM-dependent methyltransferase [Gammaproteobacteria bacterium]NIR96789.1 SAM-dependent methyltransferase [Gammaproteobacteria bacterium]NIT62489.1 SAM-dependent methyltransferase [Gammaproteobacteria bacterium]NIV19429.1 SAM-dependent methyltransferase [Gammaproteobacteria bacterium]NIX10512.1 SAM-dependent methyltransferase [Gammaproteobacteria bacterium]